MKRKLEEFQRERQREIEQQKEEALKKKKEEEERERRRQERERMWDQNLGDDLPDEHMGQRQQKLPVNGRPHPQINSR